VLSGSARFSERLALGYRDAVATADSSVHAAGTRIVGHEFHRTAVTFGHDYEPAWRFGRGPSDVVADGAVYAGVHAGYLHIHAAAHPGAATRFVAAAAASKLAQWCGREEQ
jgi:cobyrinic acid a,c-diamide synthase